MIISANKWEHDVQGYLNICNITATTPRKQIRDFAAGVNDLGLWNSMVCWPLRSSQNAGTGTTAFSLGGLGTFDGTLTNGPTWGTDGVTTDGTNDYGLATIPASAAWSFVAVMRRVNNSDTEPRYYWGLANNTASQTASLTGVTYYLKDGGLGIFQSNNSFNNWSPARPAANATTNFGFQSVAYTETGPAATASLNGSFSTQSSVMSMTAVRHDRFVFGAQLHQFAGDSNAEHALYLYITQNVSNQQVENIRDLYKTTLGTGLSLP